MELEALQEIHSEVRALGAQIVVITPELERYTRALHKKLNLTFDILTDLHLKIAAQFRLVFTLPVLRGWIERRGLADAHPTREPTRPQRTRSALFDPSANQ